MLTHHAALFVRADKYFRIKQTGCINVVELSLNHEEAGTKIVHVLKHAVECISCKSAFLWNIYVSVILLSPDLPKWAMIIQDSVHNKKVM